VTSSGLLRRLTVVALAATAFFAQGAERSTILDLPLGTRIGELPQGKFEHFACGSNGGPPLRKLAGWAEFERCEPEADGLHEIYFEYSGTTGREAGTQFDYFPVVASALFSDDGVLRALRLVTDPRPELRKDPLLHPRPRIEHYLLRLHLMDALGLDASGCQSLPLKEGETPVMGMAERVTCQWTFGDESIRIESTLVRRPGQRDVDEGMGGLTDGQFESLTRAEFRALP
jgi:hypothetical protein